MEESSKVRAICWRPDKKILAIAYSSGSVLIMDVENMEGSHSYALHSDVSCMSWTRNTHEFNIKDFSDNSEVEDFDTFLPPLPSLNTLSSLTFNKLDYGFSSNNSKLNLNFLITALKNGFVHISVYGMLSCGKIDLKEYIEYEDGTVFEIVDVKLSFDFKHIYAFVKVNNCLQFLAFENNILAKYLEPLANIAVQHLRVINTMTYISDAIQSITEAWEIVLLEMDNKLTKYASSQPEGSISSDFLELLMFGYPSEALEQFLTRDLTEKGLKKLGNSIEMSYSTIQKLVVRPLHSAIINIFYHLNSIKGMSKNTYYYKPLLGVITNESRSCAGAFLIKAFELQQTIDQSTRDYKIFFRWLYVAIIRLMDETVPDDISTVTQQEINYLAEFLNDFDHGADDNQSNKRRFNLERVGQYLVDKPLQIPQQINPKQHWDTLLEENECLKSSELVYPHNKNSSLIQEHNLLKKSIDNIFRRPGEVITKGFEIKRNGKCAEYELNEISKSKIYSTHINKEDVSLFAVMESSATLIFIECHKDWTMKSLKLQFQQKPYFENKFSGFGTLSFRHIQFYNENILSILIDDTKENGRKTSCFVQFPIQILREKVVEMSSCENVDFTKITRILNFYDVLDAGFIRNIDGFDGDCISVSGNRRVSFFFKFFFVYLVT